MTALHLTINDLTDYSGAQMTGVKLLRDVWRTISKESSVYTLLMMNTVFTVAIEIIQPALFDLQVILTVQPRQVNRGISK